VTSPSEARGELAGHVFEGIVNVDDLPGLRAERMVTQALLVEGKNRARIYEPSGTPPEGFVPAPVTLEDAYLVLMRTGALPSRETRTSSLDAATAAALAAASAEPPR
jgi:hypothetical protein